MLKTVKFTSLLRKKGYSITTLVKCLDDIKTWLALNFENLNEKKTEVMILGGSSETPLLDLGYLDPHIKPTIINLRCKNGCGPQDESQIRVIVISSFYHLRQRAKIKPISSR